MTPEEVEKYRHDLAEWEVKNPQWARGNDKTYTQMLDKIYNEGVDACIEVCREARDLEAVTPNEELFLDAIIQRIEQLKKPIQ